MANKQMNTISDKKTQIKITRPHYKLTRRAKSKETDPTKYWQE